jgi:hypothetical protein
MSGDRHRNRPERGGTATAEPSATTAGESNVRVHVSPDRLSVLLDCPNPLADLDRTVAIVMEAFRQLRLPEYPDADLLREMLAAGARPGQALVSHPLIEGYDAQPAVDGRLEWARDFFAEGWEVDPTTGAIDFWAKLDHRAVVAGEWLLKLHPPVAGEPGLTVLGQKIPVERPRKERMRCGKGVSQHDDEQGVTWFTADVSGRVRLANDTLAVDDVYIVKGNLGLATGNIRHTGTLQVEGDVEQGVTIDVNGDVVVRGMIEPCDITAGGNLQVGGGIVGQEGCAIRVGGGVQARYVRDVAIDAIGDVTIGNEVSHCVIRTLGRVLVPNGRIGGGKTIARAGITCGQAGAAGATGTVLVAGVDYLVEPQVARLEEELAQMEKRRLGIAEELSRLREAPDGEEAGQARQALLAEAAALPGRLTEKAAEIRRFIDEAEAACRPELAALQSVWSGTTIQLGNERMPVRASVRKPRLAKLLDGRVRLLPLGEGNMPEDD